MLVEEIPAPAGTLIAPYATAEGHYVDCYECANPHRVGLEPFVRAFYSQPLFRAERLVLRFAAHAPSTHADVVALAAGTTQHFAVWSVDHRSEHDLLLRAKGGRTLSWLQAEGDVLRFGSVVTPVPGRGGQLTLGPVFQSLLGAHKIYSRALLAGAARRL